MLRLIFSKYGEFPVGHPTLITENFLPVSKDQRPYKGLFKATLLPPDRLMHGVLPFRSNKKLHFPLCSECCKTEYQGFCSHPDELRQLSGTWTSHEVYKALEMGYTVLFLGYCTKCQNTLKIAAVSDGVH